jgi:hypothetical protein
MAGAIMTIAEWLCDEFGDDGDEPKKWCPDAQDLFAYLQANGYNVTAQEHKRIKTTKYVAPVERQPF